MPGRRPTVLLVEDEALLRMVESDLLEDARYGATEAASADEALPWHEANPKAVDVLVPTSICRAPWTAWG